MKVVHKLDDVKTVKSDDSIDVDDDQYSWANDDCDNQKDLIVDHKPIKKDSNKITHSCDLCCKEYTTK